MTDPPGPGFEFEPQSRHARQTASLSPIAWRRVLGCMGYAHNTAYLRTSQLERTSGQSKVCGVVGPRGTLVPASVLRRVATCCAQLTLQLNSVLQTQGSMHKPGLASTGPKTTAQPLCLSAEACACVSRDALQFHGRGFMNVIYISSSIIIIPVRGKFSWGTSQRGKFRSRDTQ